MTEWMPLTKSSVLKELLARHEFTLKKQLGQNFLIDASVLEKITQAAQLTNEKGVLEIGPGAGVVTQMLAHEAKKVVAVEKDRTLKSVLTETLSTCGNVQVEYGDVLDMNLSEQWGRWFVDCTSVVIVANLPYYITTPILFHVLESNIHWSEIIIMVQKEVADRLLAKPGSKEYGRLSVTVQYWADVTQILLVHPSSFLPSPNVDSAVVCLKRHIKPPVDLTSQDDLFRVVKAAFSQRRKTLLNALSAGLSLPKEKVAMLLKHVSVDPNRRGETLNLPEFAAIANAYHIFMD